MTPPPDVPGAPGVKLPPGRGISFDVNAGRGPEPHRSLSPPPTEGTVQFRGPSGWRVSVPTVAIAGLLAFGARFLPTPTDQSVERTSLAQEREALAQERFREEMRQELRALRADMARLDTRISVIEATAKRPGP